MNVYLEALGTVLELTAYIIFTTFNVLISVVRWVLLTVGILVLVVLSAFTVCDFERDWNRFYGFVWGIRAYYDDLMRRLTYWLWLVRKRYE